MDEDDAVLAALMRRVLEDEEFFTQLYQGWLTLDGGLELTTDEAATVKRVRGEARAQA